MKSVFSLTIIFIVFIFLGCSVDHPKSIEGAWQYVKGTSVTADTTYQHEASDQEIKIKIFTKSHFATMKQNVSEGTYGFNGGTYEIVGDAYTEHLQLHIYPEMIGFDAKAKMTLTDSTLVLYFEKLGIGENTYSLHEEWKRLD